MNLYIDKNNTLSLLSQKDIDFREDCIKMMKKHLDVYFNFSKSEVPKNESLLSLLKILTSGVGTTSKKFMEDAIPSRPLSLDCHQGMSFKKLVSMYLADDDNIKKVQQVGAINLGGVGEEFELFNRIFLLNREYKFERKFRIGKPTKGNLVPFFERWEDLSEFSYPMSDILIIDSYILDDKSLLSSNFYKLLEIFGSIPRHCLNIIIYTNHSNINVSFGELERYVKKLFKKNIGYIPNITLIPVRSQRDIKSLVEHDRTILTNSYRIYSGDSFNYFNSKGEKITKGKEISFSSLGDRDNYLLAESLLSDVQEALNFLDAKSVLGDKTSNFLTFK
ncbi:hypothetical protein [Algoriphagus persicinus]|uniref:hypothetical protein n=1 Tax=Algoriphagus persicinus TaxID=3108754 RepID=UPI002B39F76F|nr:hypothetical protein [Algoriphagus sp. E1-3-M2]MEB2786508.1 hypothetical protein [Algoriphagus sp. E1-3-M2]